MDQRIGGRFGYYSGEFVGSACEQFFEFLRVEDVVEFLVVAIFVRKLVQDGHCVGVEPAKLYPGRSTFWHLDFIDRLECRIDGVHSAVGKDNVVFVFGVEKGPERFEDLRFRVALEKRFGFDLAFQPIGDQIVFSLSRTRVAAYVLEKEFCFAIELFVRRYP